MSIEVDEDEHMRTKLNRENQVTFQQKSCYFSGTKLLALPKNCYFKTKINNKKPYKKVTFYIKTWYFLTKMCYFPDNFFAPK